MPNEVRLNPAGGSPTIKLTFGFAQFAKFRVFLWDQNGQNFQKLTPPDASNLPGSPASFLINVPAANLIGRFLTWDALIADPTGPGGQYSMDATFTQDGSAAPQNVPFLKTGKLNDKGLAVDMDQTKFVAL